MTDRRQAVQRETQVGYGIEFIGHDAGKTFGAGILNSQPAQSIPGSLIQNRLIHPVRTGPNAQSRKPAADRGRFQFGAIETLGVLHALLLYPGFQSINPLRPAGFESAHLRCLFAVDTRNQVLQRCIRTGEQGGIDEQLSD